MTFHSTDGVLGRQAIAETSTTAKHTLGSRCKAYDSTYGEGEFIYLKGVASTVAGSFVTYRTDDGTTALLVADAVGPVAVAMSANVANQYGWYQIFGKAVGKVSADFADDGQPYITATGGEVDDAVVNGDMVHMALGASAIGTPAAGLAEFEIQYPYTDNIDSND